MDSFERIVRDCAKNNRSTVIENASQEHALILIRVLFETAMRHKEEVRIVSGSLLKPFYEKLVDTARKALDSGVRFSVWCGPANSSKATALPTLWQSTAMAASPLWKMMIRKVPISLSWGIGATE